MGEFLKQNGVTAMTAGVSPLILLAVVYWGGWQPTGQHEVMFIGAVGALLAAGTRGLQILGGRLGWWSE